MPKFVDPTCLVEGPLCVCCNNIDVNTCTKVITLAKQACLSDCGVTLQTVYSKLKILWKDSSDCSPCATTPFIAYDFPMISITDEQFELVCGWSLGTKGCATCLTKLLIRDGGWARVDANSVRQEEFMGLATLGNFDTTNGGDFTAIAAPCDVEFDAIDVCACCLSTTTRTTGSWLVDGFVAGVPLTTTLTCGTTNDMACVTPSVVTALEMRFPACTFSDDVTCITAKFTQSGTGKAYFQQVANGATTCINLTGPVNQAIRIANVTAERVPAACLVFTEVACAASTIVGPACSFTSFACAGFVTITSADTAANNKTVYYCTKSGCMCTTLNLNTAETITTDACDAVARITQESDNRNFFKIYLREEQKNYCIGDLIVDQNLTRGLVNKKFAVPLSDSIDNKICCNDALVGVGCCYNCITLKFYNKNQAQCISGSSFNYRVIIDAASNPNSNVYQFVQKELRATTDICDRVCADPCPVPACNAEVTAVTFPAQSGNIVNSDYWIMRSANDQRLYHVWYNVSAGTEPVVCLSTGIEVCISACATACAVATATHSAITSVVTGLTKNTQLQDFTAAVCMAIVTVTNRANGRTTNALNSTGTSALCCLTFCVATCCEGDTATVIGETRTELLNFVGCCLVTSTGVFVDNVFAPCTNCTTHTDICGTGRQFAFVSTGTLTFNSNLVCDSGPAKYFMFYTTTPARTVQSTIVTFSSGGSTITKDSGSWVGCGCCFDLVGCADDACGDRSGDVITISNAVTGANDRNFRIRTITGTCCEILTVACTITGCDAADTICIAVTSNTFGTCRASLVDNNCDMNIDGTICMACITFDFDFDNNTQGGRVAAGSCSTVPAITIVSIGLCTAQYVVTTSSIARTKTNNISIVAALERNFDDPC